MHPRGVLYDSSYRANAWDLDFAILYGNGNFGPAAPYYTINGTAMTRSTRLKKIVGYPDPLEAWDAGEGGPGEGESQRDGRYYQHNTDPFPNAGTPYSNTERFLRIVDVSTGTGNSGGPTFVRSDRGAYGLAGILIASFGRTQVGVHGLDWTSYSMGSDALGRIGINARLMERARAKKRFKIPAGKKKYRPRKTWVSGLVGHVHTLKLKAKFVNRAGKPLQAYLKAPSGRTHFVVRGKKGKRRKVKINKDYSSKFRGAQANGVWKLYMRDKKPGDRKGRVIFKNFLLRIGD